MNREHNFRFGRMLENDPTVKSESEEGKIETYPRESFARTVCFALNNGTLTGLNYAYLVSASLNVEAGQILLEFTSCNVKLIGTCLKKLFFELLEHIPKMIECADQRYELLNEDNQPRVYEIEIIQTS